MLQTEYPHRRYNPLTGEWVLISSGRSETMEIPSVETEADRDSSIHNAECTLCPGNTGPDGRTNPPYTDIFVSPELPPKLLEEIPETAINDNELIVAHSERGVCKVMSYSPKHNLSFGTMSSSQIRAVINGWIREYSDLGAKDHINYIQIFQNPQLSDPCCSTHPHCHVWANETVPSVPGKKSYMQKEYLQFKGRVLLLDYLALEHAGQERTVFENDSFVLLSPFWAARPYETMILPRRQIRSLAELLDAEKESLAEIIRHTGAVYDTLLGKPGSYYMGIHQAPTDGEEHNEWQFHITFHPNVETRTNIGWTVTGYDKFAMPQCDMLPENAARKLRTLRN
jgi:UDPglucose--hexose-1-phosphate uridylyltransferase